VHLANFLARIISDITRDDGVETTRWYEMAVTIGNRSYRFEIPAARFAGMAWVHEHLGSKAVVTPGQGMQARLAHAIQILSTDTVEERRVLAYTGWSNIDGYNYFLTGRGALGARGHRGDIDVALPDQLSRIELVEPKSDDELREAVRASIGLLHLTPIRVSAPMLAGAYRAPVSGSDLTLGLWGKTGHGKTAFGAVVQQHYGPTMDAGHLPLTWESTANTIEAVLSAAKDVPVVVDEYVPGESMHAGAKLQEKAERVIRAVGNASGKGRMRADTTLRPARPPRCQLISTGEEVPKGQSLRARMVSIEVRAGDMNWQMLSAVQQEARAGTYATAMGGYIMWLAHDLQAYREAFKADREAIREEVEAEHKRVADAIAQLFAAWNLYLSYAVDIEAINEDMAERIKSEVWAGLKGMAAEQGELQAASEPVGRFRDLIAGALSTGRAHVVTADKGQKPESKPERWGWQYDGAGLNWRAQGDCIGWLDGDALYLEPDVAYTVASRIGSIGISPETLGQRMADKDVTVIEQTGGRRRYRVLRTIRGKRQRVFHIRTCAWLYP
jgi:hypothetical protein